MSKLYDDLFGILKDYNVKTPAHAQRHMRRLGRADDESWQFRDEMFSALENVYAGFAQQLPLVRGIVLCIDVADRRKLPEVFFRKCLMYGSTTVLLLKDARRVQRSRRHGASFSKEHDAAIPHHLIELLVRYRTLIDDGLLLPIPRSLKSLTWSRASCDINALTTALPVSMKNETLFAQFTEAEQMQKPAALGYGNLLLPSVGDATLEDVRRMRQDQAEPFHRFHKQLRKLLSESKHTTSENALLHLMQATDEEVRKLQTKVEDARRARWFTGGGLVAGVLSAVLSALAPAALGDLAAKLFGVKSLADGLSYFANWSAEHLAIHRSEFYFPWKIGFARG